MLAPENKRRGGRKRNRLTRQSNLPEEVRLKLLGYNYQEIAEKINEANTGICKPITPRQIRLDLYDCRKRWAQEILWSVNEMRIERLTALERAEMEAWKAWEKSKEISRRTVSTIHPETNERVGPISVTQEARYGDVRILDTIARIHGEISRLFGLYPQAPVESAMGSDGSQKIAVGIIINTNGKDIKEMVNFPRKPDTPRLIEPPQGSNGDDDFSGNGE